MTIPKFNELFDDLLAVLSDGSEIHRKDLRAQVIDRLNLSSEELDEKISGGGSKIGSRIHWAGQYLVQAGALVRPRRGYMQITDLGRELVATSHGNVTLDLLRTTDGMKDWREKSIAGKDERNTLRVSQSYSSTDFDTDSVPLESIVNSIKMLNSALGDELIQRIRDERPEFLERLMLKLLHAMGYGATPDDLEHTGASGDEGVDGVIRQDALGIDKIYVQVKRFKDGSGIGRPAIQAFVGALAGKQATRGVFITTSHFSKDARDYARNLPEYSVVLIDGSELAELMIANRVGVSTRQTFELMAIDENFFDEETL